MENPNQNQILLELRHIKKDYYVDKKPFTAIKDLSLCLPEKGFVAILGHSGSGKTTLLNIIGGLDKYTEGDLLIEGKSTKDFKDKDWDSYRNKRVGFVFQSYNLIPHMSVLQNVELSLQLGGVGAKQRAEKAQKVLEQVGLGEYLKKKPNQLSGGQMQRVAIARALVNDPDIILADEPTGALDSATSVQVMDLIREVGKEKLVIMVTHNQELADEYATRIISMKDGEVIADTAPLEPSEPKEEEKEVGKKTSMSFFTALRSSAQNVLTKKGRTALTAIASSFGIIGVALVLATNNGFSNYISDLEAGIASSVPISITPVTTRISLPEETIETFPKDPKLTVYNPGSSYTSIEYNDFTPEYINYIDRIMTDKNCPAYGKAMNIMYYHKNLDFHFLTKDGNTDKIRSVSQYDDAGILGGALNSVASLPATIVHELFADKEGLAPLYDTIAGRFPTKADEMAIILTQSNRIDFSTMRKLGFYRSDTNFDTEKNLNNLDINFSDILYEGEGDTSYRVYKAYTNSSFYNLPSDPAQLNSVLHDLEVDSYPELDANITQVDGKYKIEVTGEPGKSTIKAVENPSITDVYNDPNRKAIECKIVGVLRPTESSVLQLMPPSLAYTPALTKMMVDDYAEGTSTHALGKLQQNNWIVPHVTLEDGSDDPNNDGKAVIQTFFNAIANLDLGTLMPEDPSDMSNTDLATLSSLMTNQLSKAFRFFYATGFNKGNSSFSYTGSTNSYLSSCRNLGVTFPKTDLINFFENFFADLKDGYMTFGDLFRPGEKSMMTPIAYANSYGLISSILIFPKALTTKDALKQYLDDWNKDPAHNKITYSDIMSDLTSSLGIMVNVISAVLIVFASISLVVSSVMTAIITYVSVIERTKEIGVLRACGGRKKDVGRLFEAECVIIGAIAGIIGIAFTVVACFPINAILNAAFPGNGLGGIASLHPLAAVLLFVLSIGLSFLSGYIPARIAAKRDPVTCLRSE